MLITYTQRNTPTPKTNTKSPQHKPFLIYIHTQHPMEVFQQVDKDNSGEIDVNELADMLLLDDLADSLGSQHPKNKQDALTLAHLVMNNFSQHSFGFDEWDEFLACLQSIVQNNTTTSTSSSGTSSSTTTPKSPSSPNHKRRQRRHSITVCSSTSKKSTFDLHTTATTPTTPNQPTTDQESKMVMRYQFEAEQSQMEAIHERKKRQELQNRLEEMESKLKDKSYHDQKLKQENNELKKSVSYIIGYI